MDLRSRVRFRHSGVKRALARHIHVDRLRPFLMTADTDNDPSREPITAHEPARRSGSIVLVLLVAGGIVAVAIALMTIGRAQAQPYLLNLLPTLATVRLLIVVAY